MDPEVTIPTCEVPDRLRPRVREAPNVPGVYRMRARNGEVIYVGKAKRLRTRLLSHLRAGPEEKSGRILRETERIDWQDYPNEFASLVAELRLIQRFRPRFNVRHRRRPTPVFLVFGPGPAPALQVQTVIPPGCGPAFGPVRGAARMRLVARDLANLFGLRDCPARTPMMLLDQRELFQIDREPACYRGEMGFCVSPCAGRATEGAYRRRVEAAARFLRGEDDSPLDRIRRAMQRAADQHGYEHAARLRDRIERLQTAVRDIARITEGAEGLSGRYRIDDPDSGARLYGIVRGCVVEETGDGPGRTLPSPARGPAARRIRNALEERLLVEAWFRHRPGERRRVRPLSG